MRRRTRLTLLTISGSLVVLVLLAVLAVYLLLQPKRFTDLLRAKASQAGLTLTLSSPAEPDLWPRPAVVLHGLTLSVDNRPVLVAARARLVVPWRALLGGPVTITRLELDAPRINLAQLGPVLTHLHAGASGPPSLPHINAGIRISHGSIVRGNDLLLDDIHLETGPLSPGHIFSLKLTANTSDGHPVELALLMTPHVRKHAISFDNIHITANVPSGIGVRLDGQALWRGGSNLTLSLQGTLTRSHDRTYEMALSLDHAHADAPLTFHLTLTGPGMHADLYLSPARLANWWHAISSDAALAGIPLPPVDGTLTARKLTFDGLHIEGLRITAGSAVAASSSAPAPAASSAAKP